MRARSYEVAIVSVDEEGYRENHRGVIQLVGEHALSGINEDESLIADAVLKAYPEATDYLPMRIPNRQFRKVQQEHFMRTAVENLVNNVMAGADEAEAWQHAI